MKTDLPLLIEVSRTIREAKNHKTVFFEHEIDVRPGQFFMLWIPGVDEKPYATAYHSKNEFGFTSHKIGKWTTAFDKLKKGDKIGIRGPYGNSFSIKKNVCVIGGGVGMSSVSFLIDNLSNPIIINGARSKDYLIYLKRFKNKEMIATTDDGSFGKKGFTTEALKELLEKRNISFVYACGPEIMMKKILDLCNQHKVGCELSLERYMACGYGICGKCTLDDQLICIDGPIYNSRMLNKFTEFGKYARIKSGRKVTIQEFANWREK